MGLTEKRYPPGWFGDGWEYAFRVEQPPDRDVHRLIVVRWRGEPDHEREYLSTGGWRPVVDAEVFEDLIEMSGLRHHNEQRIAALVIDAMVIAMGVERDT